LEIQDGGCDPKLLLGAWAVEREAISLAPWLQPGGQVLRNNSLIGFQRFLVDSPANKTVRNGSKSIPIS
jgi:hypothetical protein